MAPGTPSVLSMMTNSSGGDLARGEKSHRPTLGKLWRWSCS